MLSMDLENIPPEILPQLNQLIKSKQSFYLALADKGHYLPSYDSKAITGQYLWKVFLKKVSIPMRNQVKIGYIPNYISKMELYETLDDLI